MTYVAKESFRSTGGDRFSFGQEIGDYQYNKLTRDEKMKFRRKYSSDESSAQSSPDQGIIWNPLPDYGDNTPSPSHSDTHSFGGYGGGDTGGGGSDSSWDSGSSDSGGFDGGGGDGGGGGGD